MTGKMLAALVATMTLAVPVAASTGSSAMDVIVDGRAGTETRSVTVSLADLNLASTHGVRMADSRITKAAKRVCGWLDGSIQQPTREYRTCFGDAMGEARTDLSNLVQAQRQG